MKLPVSFENRMKEMLREDYAVYEASLDTPFHHGLRVNTSKISVEEFLKISPFSLQPVPWTTNGFYYDESGKPAKHPYYFAGLYYLQEPSAMTPASMLPVEDGDMVLDLCAAPGGKSTELGVRLHNTGMLVSNDISNSRAKALLKNIELFGIGNVAVVSEPPNTLLKYFEGCFDKILIDAPCSGEGMFRKSYSMVTAWENNGVDLFVNLQRSILKDAVKLLKPGGTMLYSTCTFSPEENEQSIEYLLELDDSLSLVELPIYDGFDRGHPEWGKTGNPELSKTRRLWPHRIEGEGHFVAMVKKAEGTSVGQTPYAYGKGKLSPEAENFIKSLKLSMDFDRVEVAGERVFYMPEKMPHVKGLRLLRTGLLLGEMKKNRFEPSQALAMHLKMQEFDNAVSLPASDPRVIKYLKGETIELSEGVDGWLLLCVDGYPLGFGKMNRGTLKNKYLAGWRYQ